MSKDVVLGFANIRDGIIPGVMSLDIHQFRPVIASRRSELSAWFLTLLSGGAWLVLALRDSPPTLFIPLFFFLFIFTAIGASLGNWIDRRTVLRLKPEGLDFENGLRKVEMNWEEIQEIQIIPSRWGQAVHVLGNGAHFRFRILANVVVLGKASERIGFEDGDKILGEILKKTGLQRVQRSQPGRYYARN